MIRSFKILGESILHKEGYYDNENESEKRELFLKHQTFNLAQKRKDDNDERALLINFDRKNKKIFFNLDDKDIAPQNRFYYFALEHPTPREERKFWSTNCPKMGGNPHFGKTVSDSLKDLKTKRKSKKSGQWLQENVDEKFDDLLMEIRDDFHKSIHTGKDVYYVLNDECLEKDEQEIISGAEEIDFASIENSNKKKGLEKCADFFNFIINKKLFGKNSKSPKDFPPITMIKIDGKHILELEEYKDAYINLAYFYLFERFFIERGKKDKICHICRKESDVIGEAPLPMKFYGTTNILYFEGLNNRNAYKAFSICKSCLREVLTGMSHVRSELGDSIFGIPCCLVPSIEKRESNFEKKYKRIFNLLKTNKGYADEIEQIKKLVKKSARKNFSFDLLLYDSPPGSQAFDIIKLIPNIEYKKLIEKLAHFDAFSKHYQLALLNKKLSLLDIRYNLFPSKYSHGKQETKRYRKEILNLFEAFLHEHSLNYHDLVKRFMAIYRRKFHRNAVDQLSPFYMVVIFTIINESKELRGISAMKEGHAATTIQNEEYARFFETHADIYNKNYFRQGLFLLGVVINGIVNAQRKKWKKKAGDSAEEKGALKPSSTFLKKLNYSGIHARRIPRLIAEVQNYAQIYDIYEEKGIWGNIMDRLQGIEDARMKGEEVVFYILTGVAYGKYLGQIKNIKK